MLHGLENTMRDDHTINSNQFGKTIKEARERAGFGLRQAALKMCINPGYLSSLENNLHKAIPSDEVLKKLSKLLDLNFKEIQNMAMCVAPDLRGFRQRLTKEEAQGMQLFYRFTKEHKLKPAEAVAILKNKIGEDFKK